MAEPANIILEFLRKHHFAKAEAAFMAELRDRPNILADNALDWDLQLSSFTSMYDADDSKDSLPENMHVKISEKKQSAEILPGKLASPPEKQLYVEYEPGKFESLQDASNIARKSLDEDGAISLPDNYDLGPPYNENNRGKRCIQQQGRSLMTSQSASSSERLIADCNQASKASDKSCERYFIDRDNKGLHFQDLSNGSSSFQRLPGLQSPSTQSGNVWSETTGYESGKEVAKSSEPSASSKSGKEEARVSEHEKFSTSPTRNIVKISKQSSLSVDGCSKNLSEITNQQWAKSMEVTNNFITGSTSCGHTALKTCLPPFLKNPQQEEQTRMLMPDDTEEIRNQYTIGDGGIAIGKLRSGVIGYSLAKEPTELKPNGIREEEFPVKLQSVERNLDVDGRHEDPLKSVDINPLHITFGFSTLEDDPLDQEALLSGTKKHFVYPSVSDDVMETMPDELSGFAMPGERWYGDEYCDSDTYDDEDDPGYCRQLIDDEEWFLAYEIDYPRDSERPRYVMDKNTVPVSRQSKKVEDGHSYIDEESYFTGEEYYKLRAAKDDLHVPQNSELDQAQVTSKIHDNDIPSRDSDESKIDETEELSFVGSLPSWKGFMGRPNEVKREDVAIGAYRSRSPHKDDFEEENQGSVRSGGNLGSSGAVNIGSEVREDNLSGQNSEGDLESLREQGLDLYSSTLGKFDPEDFLTSEGETHREEKSRALNNVEKEEQEEDNDEDEQDPILQYYNEAWGYSKRSSASKKTNVEAKHLAGHSNKITPKNHVSEGFSFPSPSSTGEIAASLAGSGNSLYSNRDSPVSVPGPGPDIDAYSNSGMVGPDNTLAAWKKKSDNSLPFFSSVGEAVQHPIVPRDCSDSNHSTDEYASLEAREDRSEELGVGIGSPAEFKSSVQGEKETIAAPEEDKSMVIDADQYEIFDLRIIHRKNRTGFEEAKEFPVMLNSVIAGRYHVTEYLGSAAFSKAIQAHDLHTGIDVCMKIIKNNKDFFDQSLDEIKLLKFINKHDPADKYHVLRLYDYFYHREHLFIVCELLRANLYEFQKFNRESGGEVYFTMSRIQSITRQCLEALEFLHGLGIIHCDLKPENILVKSYSRCEIKVIDLGSSCFQTDHLCSYVQSRSYRAPEVILGLPYDQKIDIWSMGCILAELSSGNVLFQNDSLATLLARVVGILGPIDPHVLAKGRDTHKYFTKNYMLYERNQESGRLEYLLPKKTSLRHRIPMGDQGFVEFVRYLLQSDPAKRPTAAEALHHPWLSFPYEPISS